MEGQVNTWLQKQARHLEFFSKLANIKLWLLSGRSFHTGLAIQISMGCARGNISEAMPFYQ